MSESDRLEAQLRNAAAALAYPPTPDVAANMRRRLRRDVPVERLRLAWAALVVIAVLVGLLAAPQVRAGLLEVLQIGVVRIFLVPPTVTATPTGTMTLTPQATPTLLPSLLDLAGETTLAEARQQMSFDVLLPAYPADLGLPDHVYAQNLDGPAMVLVWLDRDRPGRIRLSIHEFGQGSIIEKKFPPTVIATTTVGGQPAVWVEGPYVVELKSGVWDVRRLVEGHALIWASQGMTYRIETDLSLEEAVKIAESLK